MRSLLLGIDTGGTYTDAVLVDSDAEAGSEVISFAKALTTRHNLAQGIGESVDAVLTQSGASAQEIKLCSVSTTLATNALVEGHGGRVALIAVGFTDDDMTRAGLNEALGSDSVVRINGGHDAHGVERAPLDVDALAKALAELAPAPSGYAVVSQFGVRNPGHELAVRNLIGSHSAAPVTCSHELTAKLNGPRRALTSLLNARLIPLIDSLLSAASGLLAERKINAPLMVVRGDGTLLSMEVARKRPIETILSGPAASVVGAQFLTDETDAIISDIGGTTTDIAILRGGKPHIDTSGATVGGHRTMVEAVAINTYGLGGDSRVAVDDGGLTTKITLGPGRVVPISMLATQHPDVVMASLERETLSETTRERDGQFAILIQTEGILDADDRARDLMEALAGGPRALNDLIGTKRQELVLDRLVRAGAVRRAGFTPTDACHVLGHQDDFSAPAARMAAKLFARQKDRRSEPIATGGADLSQRVVDLVVRNSAELILDSAFEADGFSQPGLTKQTVVQAALDRHVGIIDFGLSVSVPIVGLGAGAKTYYPAVADLLGSYAVLSPYSGVANAVGAVVGQVAMTGRATIAPLKNGRFRSHAGSDQRDFDSPDLAAAHAVEVLTLQMTAAAADAGAIEPSVTVTRDDNTVRADGTELFIEATVTVVASGRPRLG